jgi:hypothetical protein
MEEHGRLPDDLDFDSLYRQYKDRLPKNIQLTAAKAGVVGHTMGACGLIALLDNYLLGDKAVGVPNFRELHPKIGDEATHFDISADPIDGNDEGVQLTPVQGFGGPNAAIVNGSPNPDFLRSLSTRDKEKEKIRDKYLAKVDSIGPEWESREARELRELGWGTRAATRHRWRSVKDT